jgi:hypothetical protein
MTANPNPLSVEGRRRAKAAAYVGVTTGVAAAREEWHRDPNETPTEPVRKPEPKPAPSPETDTEQESETLNAAAVAAAAEAQERQLTAWADEYEQLLPFIRTAAPLPAQPPQRETQLVGAEWIADRVRTLLTPGDPSRFQVNVFVKNGSVFANVTCPPDSRRREVGNFLAAKIREQGNLGEFEVKRHSDPRTVTLQRRGIEGAGTAWAGHGTRARLFYETEEGRNKVFDLAGLFQTNRREKTQRRYPWVKRCGEDHRFGSASLSLSPVK